MSERSTTIRPPSRSARLADALRGADPRAKVAATLALGLITWRSGPVGLACIAVPAAAACAALGAWDATHARTLRAYLLFVLLWSGVKFGMDAFFPPAGLTLGDNLAQAGLLGARLALLIALGLALARATNPRRLGLALAWALRPVLGRHAWKTALSLALMLHFIPLVHETATRARTALALRAPRCSRRRRVVLAAQTVLRSLSRRTWGQTLAVAARGLDEAEAWSAAFVPQPRVWLATTALIASAWAASLI
ncbi:MAG: hypothetical protein H0S85_13400 [Desulfovibrionaceae bacterium]|jgi:biotin transport system permease protein|nr:hypothetical protein [Desulfovibrionaceae bacterium]